MSSAQEQARASSTEDGKRIDFQTHPDRYHHWNLTIDGNVARLAMDVDEDATLVPAIP